MSLKSIVIDELKQTPVAAVSGAIGAAVAAVSLIAAWLQPRATVSPSPPASGPLAPPNDLLLANLLLSIAYFVGITVTCALILRAVGRKHDIAAFLASIPVVSLSNFSAVLVVYLAPPRPLNSQLFASAHDLILYASASIFLAICGSAILGNIANAHGRSHTAPASDSKAGGDGLAALFVIAILLALWSLLVFAGQTRLTRTLLPEITHPSEPKAPVVSGETK
jgi:hypothetical protein